MTKKVAILQSNYIPWKGYFDLIAAVDEFIIYDDAQYTRRDWRNRNQIKTRSGIKWISVPVKTKGKYFQLIKDTEIDGTDWSMEHCRLLKENYASAPHYKEIIDWLEPLYLENSYRFISHLNRRFIETICDYLEINTVIKHSSDFRLVEGKTERLASLCTQTGASEYISGLAAMNYLDESVFTSLDIKLTWFDYSGYSEYPQLWGKFIHGVTILDLLFNCGKDAPSHMRYKMSITK